MPSYFNSGEAVRVFFTKETKTAEQKKMYNKLLRIWSRAVRVGGTKGGFYYQRSCSTIKGKKKRLKNRLSAAKAGSTQFVCRTLLYPYK